MQKRVKEKSAKVLERKVLPLNNFILENLEVFWQQVNPAENEYRKVLIADLKNTRTGGEWELFPTFESFREYAHKRVMKFGADSVLGVYVTKERYLWDGTIAHIDLIMDIDGKDNDLQSLEKIVRLEEILEGEYGVEPLFKLSGGGIHVQLQHDIFKYTEKLTQGEFQDLVNKTYMKIVKDLQERTGIVFDTKVYSSGRLFRAVYSPHETKNIIAIPFKPGDVETFEELVKRAREPIVKPVQWGLVKDLFKFSLKLGEAYTIIREMEEKKKHVEEEPRIIVRRKRGGMLTLTLEDGRIVKYSAELDGYGYLRTLIEEKIPLEDAREDFIWYALSKAYVKGIITKKEAYDYIRVCWEANPQKPLENYIKKFEGNIRQDIAPPTFVTILTLKDKKSTQLATLEHIREELLKALEKHKKLMVM